MAAPAICSTLAFIRPFLPSLSRTPLSLALRLFLTFLPLSLSRGLARPITGATDSFIHIFLFFFPFFHSQANPLLHPTLPRFLRGFRSTNQTRLSLCCCLLWNGKWGAKSFLCVCVCVRARVCEWGEETFRQGTFRYDFRFDNVERRNIGAIL